MNKNILVNDTNFIIKMITINHFFKNHAQILNYYYFEREEVQIVVTYKKSTFNAFIHKIQFTNSYTLIKQIYVLVSLTQLVWTIYNILQTPDHHKKKKQIYYLNNFSEYLVLLAPSNKSNTSNKSV